MRTSLRVASLLVAVLAPRAPLRAQYTEFEKLLPPTVGAGDRLGSSAAVDGSWAAVGAPFHDDPVSGVAAGIVYVFEFDVVQGGWVLAQELKPSGSVPQMNFGYSVAMSGDLLVVGSFDDSVASNAGAAHVYRRSGGQWLTEQTLRAPAPQLGDLFGQSVAASGDLVAVGAPLDDDNGASSGSVFLFRHQGGTTWLLEESFTGEAGDQLGSSVAVSGVRAAAGAPLSNAAGQDFGAVRVYLYDAATQAWSLEDTLLATGGKREDQLGTSIAMDGDVVIAGAPFHDLAVGVDAGLAVIFRRVAGIWTEEQGLRAFDRQAGDQFGRAVALRGNAALVGSPFAKSNTGSAYLFRFLSAVCGWVEDPDRLAMVASDAMAGDNFGSAVDLSGPFAMIGASRAAATGVDSGAAYAFATAEVSLHAHPPVVSAGQTLNVRGGNGEPGEPTLLALVAVNGVPVFSPVLVIAYRSNAAWTLTFTVPSGIPSGLTVTLQLFEVVECLARAAASNPVTVTFL